MDIKQCADRIITDFPFFCRVCLTIPARDWKVPPNESTIKDVPFILAQHQLDYIDYLQRDDISDKTVLKTRQRGYSVVSLAYVLWLTLYGYNQNLLYTIHKADVAKELARLIKRMWGSIPAIFKPADIHWRMQPDRVTNVRRNNSLILKTASEDVARGGTFSMSILDEYAAYTQTIQDEIAASLTSSCPNNRIWISTPRRENDNYHRKVIEAEKAGNLWRHEYWDYYEDWFGSEDIAKSWRTEQEKGLTPTQIIRELDCGFRGAAENVIWYTEPEFFVNYPVGAKSKAIVSLDLGWEDETAILFSKELPSRSSTKLYVFDEAIVKENTIPQVAQIIKSHGYPLRYGVCDSSGRKVDQTSGVSSWKYLSKLLGCQFRTKKFPDKEEMYRIAQRELLLGRVVINPERCPFLLECFNNYAWVNGKIPHDRYSHIHDSFVYLVYNWLKFPSAVSKPRARKRLELGIHY
jgi:hypothetical protein